MSAPKRTPIRYTEPRLTPARETLRQVEPGTAAWDAALEQMRADGLIPADETPVYNPNPSEATTERGVCSECGAEARLNDAGGYARTCSQTCDTARRKRRREERELTEERPACTECDAPARHSFRGGYMPTCSTACDVTRSKRLRATQQPEEEKTMPRPGRTVHGTCAVCGQDFTIHGFRGGRAPSVCSDECKAERHREHSRVTSKREPKPPTPPPPTTADTLTDAQAEVWMARLQLLRAEGAITAEAFGAAVLEVTRRQTGTDLRVEVVP